jgi:hypothetical protein
MTEKLNKIPLKLIKELFRQESDNRFNLEINGLNLGSKLYIDTKKDHETANKALYFITTLEDLEDWIDTYFDEMGWCDIFNMITDITQHGGLELIAIGDLKEGVLYKEKVYDGKSDDDLTEFYITHLDYNKKTIVGVQDPGRHFGEINMLPRISVHYCNNHAGKISEDLYEDIVMLDIIKNPKGNKMMIETCQGFKVEFFLPDTQ